MLLMFLLWFKVEDILLHISIWDDYLKGFHNFDLILHFFIVPIDIVSWTCWLNLYFFDAFWVLILKLLSIFEGIYVFYLFNSFKLCWAWIICFSFFQEKISEFMENLLNFYIHYLIDIFRSLSSYFQREWYWFCCESLINYKKPSSSMKINLFYE